MTTHYYIKTKFWLNNIFCNNSIHIADKTKNIKKVTCVPCLLKLRNMYREYL